MRLFMFHLFVFMELLIEVLTFYAVNLKPTWWTK